MKLENHISDILQLYEYSMSIGKTLDYNQNCDQFLKLLLKRINFNACWILKKKSNTYTSQYSIPVGDAIVIEYSQQLEALFVQINDYKIFPITEIIEKTSPIKIKNGEVLILNLKEEGYLFLYSKDKSFDKKLNRQLYPVIQKFSHALKACRAFSQQQLLLNKLEESNQDLNNYAHVVSHDLKSPIRNIETLVSWLESELPESSDKNSRNYIDLIHQNILKMEKLINSILDYSVISNKEYYVSSINSNNLISDIIKTNYIPDHFQIKAPKNLPIIFGDQYRLHQLFQNLLTNAVKYNNKPKGLIEIGYRELKDFHKFSVKDNGIGIKKDYHEKIFETFQKLENSQDSAGIGLSIVRKIVRSYKGTVWLESELGKGTTFFFTLSKEINN